MTGRCVFQSPIGYLEIREENEKITNISLLPAFSGEKSGMPAQISGQPESGRIPQLPRREVSPLLQEACAQLGEYFSGKRKKFQLPLRCTGTLFQQKVWEALQEIPYGETRSYADIAAWIGKENAFRAVGQANHKNPVMIIVPCHRIINKNGGLGGYACGLEAKKYLLDLEQKYKSV